ncbi:MAG: serine protease [Roseateles sp.]|uniref:S1C family serine protease n=1 Tax=Roseateles sp. TaxID=1971397 RepID=UPI0039E83051
MKRRAFCTLAAALATAAGGAAAEESLPDLIARAKPAVVLVGTYGALDSPKFSFRGTGFVVGDGLTVVTNAHVIAQPADDTAQRSLAIQVWSAGGGWTLRQVKQMSGDPFRDLAVLRVEGDRLPALTLATTPVREGAAIALMGFPLGGALGFSHVTHRGIVAARTAIASAASNFQALNARALRQLREGSFDILQLDATAYRGNSGGPVFDLASGEVVGVVSMSLAKDTKESALNSASGISYAIPAADVLRLLR